MTQTNPVHPKARKFAIRTGADNVRPLSDNGDARIEYSDGPAGIIRLDGRSGSELPDGFNANLSFSPTPTIDLFEK